MLSACGRNAETIQPTAISTLVPAITVFPTSELSPYYGEPEPIQIIFDGKTYNSQIGTTSWILEIQPDGTTAVMIGDAFAINTPIEPIITKSSFSFTLKLPIPINPAELWYVVYKVSEEELKSKDKSHGIIAWNPDYTKQVHIQQTNLPLSSEQQLAFSLESGIFVLEVNAGWGDRSELQADYGFLIEVQE